MFYGRHLKHILGLWFAVALPSCAAVYLIGRRIEVGLWMPASIVFLASAPFGVMLATTTAERAFGRQISLRRTLQRALRHDIGLFAYSVLVRLATAVGLLVCLVPGALVALYNGFFVEKRELPRTRPKQDEGSAKDLVRDEMGELCIRGIFIALFCLALFVVVFLTVDLLMQILFGFPILLGRLARASGSYYVENYAASLLWSDPIVQTALAATWLLVYPIGRVAWFFCYIDLQVRRDCWDLQVQFLQEVKRLKTPTPGSRQGEAA